jgi:hypothetical protein
MAMLKGNNIFHFGKVLIELLGGKKKIWRQISQNDTGIKPRLRSSQKVQAQHILNV